MKIIKYKSEAREALKDGVKIIHDAVASTLGAAGRGVIIDSVLGMPSITADGVSVAKEVETDLPFEQMGVALVKSVAMQADAVGDGTTTATVLAYEMLSNDALAKSHSPILFRIGMEKALKDTIEYITSNSHKIRNKKQLQSIATISSRGDAKLGKLIAEGYKHIGKDGRIVVTEGRGEQDSIEHITGYQIDRGFYHEMFVNNKKRNLAEFENPFVFVTDLVMKDVNDLSTIYKTCSDPSRPIVIISPETTDDLILAFTTNTLQGTIKGVFIEAPEYGEKQSKMIEDIAFVLGCKPFLAKHGHSFKMLDKMTIPDAKEFYGTCTQVSCGAVDTVFIGGLQNPVEYLKEILPTQDKEWEQRRKSKLAGKLSKLVIGATSAVEMREKRDRTEDSVNATRASLEEGFVAGGGVALFRASLYLKRNIEGQKTKAEQAGYELIIKSLESPLKQILTNLFEEDTAAIEGIMNTLRDESHDQGYDVKEMKFCNMVEAGIVDPLKVTKSSLTAAFSVASTILNTNCIIAETGSAESLRL